MTQPKYVTEEKFQPRTKHLAYNDLSDQSITTKTAQAKKLCTSKITIKLSFFDDWTVHCGSDWVVFGVSQFFSKRDTKDRLKPF